MKIDEQRGKAETLCAIKKMKAHIGGGKGERDDTCDNGLSRRLLRVNKNLLYYHIKLG